MYLSFNECIILFRRVSSQIWKMEIGVHYLLQSFSSPQNWEKIVLLVKLKSKILFSPIFFISITKHLL